METSSGDPAVPKTSSHHEVHPAHPLEHLRIRHRRRLAAALVPLAVALWWLFAYQLDRVGTFRVTELATAGANDAAKILTYWSRQQLLPRAAFNVGVDYLFIVLYLVTLSVLCLLGTRRPRLRWAGVVIAWLLLGAAVFDIVENYSLLRLIDVPLGGDVDPSLAGAPLAQGWFIAKAVIIGLGLVYFVLWLFVYLIDRRGWMARLALIGATAVAVVLIWTEALPPEQAPLAVAGVLYLGILLVILDRERVPVPDPEPIVARRGLPIDRMRQAFLPLGLSAAALILVLWVIGPNAGNKTIFKVVVSSSSRASELISQWNANTLVDVALRMGLFYLALVATLAAMIVLCLWMVKVPRWGPWALAGASVQILTAASGLVFADAIRRIVLPGSKGEVANLARVAKVSFWIGAGSIIVATAIGTVSVLVWAWRTANGRSETGKRRKELGEEPTVWDRIRDWIYGSKPEPRVVERDKPAAVDEQLGICCSGGGIRSAAFNLGALQALQSVRETPGKDPTEFERARYLAAVSGGSYIAAGHAIVRKESVPLDPPAFSPGSVEERYLRNRSSYLAPGAGGKWNALWRLLRGLFVNLSLVTAVLFLAGFLFGIFARPVVKQTAGTWDVVFEHTSFEVAIWILIGVAGVAILIGVIEVVSHRRDAVSRGLEAWVVRLINVVLVGLGLFVGMPYLLKFIANNRYNDLLRGISFGGIGGILAGVGLQLGSARAAAKKEAKEEAEKAEGGAPKKRLWDKMGPRLRQLAIVALVSVLGPAATLAAFVLFARIGINPSTSTKTLIAFLLAVAWLGLLWIGGDLTSWSMHPFYRRRLASAFALRRRRMKDGTIVAEEFTDRPVHFARWDESERPFPAGPELVVCAAANVSDPGAVPPGRRVVSFTFSPTSIDGTLVGTMPTVDYQRAVGRRFQHEITIPAAVAISGAAISPAMGKLTKPAYTFLLALANVRLGVWLPSPNAIRRWIKGAPNPESAVPVPFRARPHYLLKELFGLTSIRDRFVYVTDGGHYENLGLVELLARGCTEIYCFDASGDAENKYRTLGQAIAIARMDLGVEIEVNPTFIDADGDHLAESVVAVGKFRFNGDPQDPDPAKWRGKLVYVKAGVPRKIAWDVRAYQIADPAFPHHSTASQLFTDERFEAYRALGTTAARRAFERMCQLRTGRPTPPDEPATRVEQQLVSANGPGRIWPVSRRPRRGRIFRR